MKNVEGWRMKDEGWWFQAVEGFCRQTNERTNEQTDICDCRVAFATENECNGKLIIWVAVCRQQAENLKVLKSKEEGKRFPSFASEHFKYLESHRIDSYFLFPCKSKILVLQEYL